MANFRPRVLIAATVLATLALLISAAAASATPVRVEGPRGNVFQGTVTPFVGTLKDQDGVSHTTREVTALGALGVVAVGANCGRGPEEMEVIVEQMVQARPDGLRLVAQSNAGLPVLVGDHFAYDKSPHDMAEHARRLRAAGVDLIGACCGSTPEHLLAMREALAV